MLFFAHASCIAARSAELDAIPVSVFITVGGGIYFLYLLLAGKRA